MSSRLTRSLTSILTAAALAAVLVPPATAQILLRDDFDDTSGPAGAQGDGVVDVSTYRTPSGDGAFLGRTQLRFDLPSEGVSTTDMTSTDGKVAVIELDTFNPIDPGAAFFGTDLITKSNFARGGGLRWEGRMRLREGTPGGLVGAGFLYDVTRVNVDGDLVRDEIDHELLSNDGQGATPHNTFTNIWDDGAFVGPGAGGTGAAINTAPVSGSFSLNEFNNYRIDWLPNRVDYFINDTLVRTESGVVPDDPMSSHFNLWAPDDTFTAAYDPSLVPTAIEANNQNYALEVDYVQIERLNTDTTERLVDGSFEDTFELLSVSGDGPAPGFDADTETGEWVGFNKAFLDASGSKSSDGFNSVLTFGPFSGGSNASGIWQNAEASPGQEFRASVKTITEMADSIFTDTVTGLYDGDAKPRFLELSLSFRDENGDSILEIPGNPDSVAANANTTTMLDSREQNQQALEDEWITYTVDAIAPEGTALVRYQLNFVQVGSDGGSGAAFFDEASLLLLDVALSGLAGDYNNDGLVDAADYTVWRDADGSMTDLSNDPIGGTVGAAQYTQWANNFGQVASSTSATIPEPTSVLLGVIGALSLGLRRRV